MAHTTPRWCLTKSRRWTDVENKSYEQALVKEYGMSPAEVIANLQAQLAERQEGYIDEQHRLNEQEHQQKVAAQAQNLPVAEVQNRMF